MRWDELFADLEAQLEAGLGAEEREAEVEEERLRIGRSTLRDRIAAIAVVREPLRLRLVDGSLVEAAPRTVGRDWIAADLPGGAQVVVPLAAVAALLPTAAQLRRSLDRPPAGPMVTDRVGVAVVLRDLARRRRTVAITTRGGRVTGTLDRVGRDHLDVAVHPPDGVRRASEVARVEVLALTEVLLVRVD